MLFWTIVKKGCRSKQEGSMQLLVLRIRKEIILQTLKKAARMRSDGPLLYLVLSFGPDTETDCYTSPKSRSDGFIQYVVVIFRAAIASLDQFVKFTESHIKAHILSDNLLTLVNCIFHIPFHGSISLS